MLYEALLYIYMMLAEMGLTQDERRCTLYIQSDWPSGSAKQYRLCTLVQWITWRHAGLRIGLENELILANLWQMDKVTYRALGSCLSQKYENVFYYSEHNKFRLIATLGPIFESQLAR